MKEYNSLFREEEDMLGDIGIKISFSIGKIEIEGFEMEGHWKKIWANLKIIIKQKLKQARQENYMAKKLQSYVWKYQTKSAHKWLKKRI